MSSVSISKDVKVVAGRLTAEQFGSSMPVDAPYYQNPPFYYRDARNISITYETDADAAAAMLPEGLDLPVPAVATVVLVHYPTSTFGPYNEAILSIACELDGARRSYIPHIVVDTVPPLVGGREIWGFPKKIAHITIEQEDEFLRGAVERPKGVRLISAAMRPEAPLNVDEGGDGGALSLRVIPSVEEGKPPSVAELIETAGGARTTHEAWSGPATLSFDACSDLDPWHRLPVVKLLGGIFSRADFTLPHGRVVRTY